jgi:tRNA A22 N-methylase
LRRWLVDHGYSIVEETLIREGRRFCVVIAAEPRPDAALASQGALESEDLLEAGPCLVRSGDPLVREYWERALRREQRILERCGGGERASRSRHRRDRALRVLAALNRRDETVPPSLRPTDP